MTLFCPQDEVLVEEDHGVVLSVDAPKEVRSGYVRQNYDTHADYYRL
jgi:hypothetical protein